MDIEIVRAYPRSTVYGVSTAGRQWMRDNVQDCKEAVQKVWTMINTDLIEEFVEDCVAAHLFVEVRG